MDEIRRFVLPVMALRVLGRALDITVDHAPLELPLSAEATGEAVTAAYGNLATSGLYTAGGLRSDVEGALRLFADPAVAVTVSADLDDGAWNARASFEGRRAVLVEQLRGDVIVTRLPVPGWEPSLAALLPPLRPAPGEPVTSVVDGSGREIDEHTSALAHLPSSSGPSTLADVAEVLAAPRTGSGHFVVTTRTSRTTPATPPLSWVDTEAGAYAMTTTGGSGRVRTDYVPVDNGALGTLLTERVSELRPVAV